MRMRSAGWGAAVLVLLTLGGAWWLVSPASTVRARPRPPVSSELAAVPSEREVEALRARLARLEIDVERQRARDPKATNRVAPEVTTRSGATQVALSSEEQELAWRAHVREVEQDFRREPLNRDWSTEMVGKVHAASAASELTAGLVLDVECHSRSCRVELADAEPRRLLGAVEYLIREMSSDLQNAAIGHTGDLTSPTPSVLYLARARPDDSVPLIARQ